VASLFYGHYFYGLCAAAQVAETTAQLALPQNWWLYCLSFVVTTLFYNYPYSRPGANSTDPRVIWHARHRRGWRWIQRATLVMVFVLVAWMLWRHHDALQHMTVIEWAALLVFPAVGALYYRVPRLSPRLSLRRVGWLKPFVIGFVWSGLVVAYPILFARLQYGVVVPLAVLPVMLFIKTLMFVAVLAMLFDIKDHEADRRHGVGTIVALVGLEATLFRVSIPLTILGMATFVSYALMHELSAARMALVLAPFVLLVAGILSLRTPRPIIYYLTVIDGLMLAKAFLDVLSMQF
jgi:4-hydroxybenzoate polyprenyltransferase